MGDKHIEEVKFKFLSDKPTDKDTIGLHKATADVIYKVINSNIEKPFVMGLFGR